MTVTYIFHSCFLIEFEKYALIIDYYKDSEDKTVEKFLSNYTKPLYVFCTHSHQDHFNKAVLDWKNHFTNIRYIFSEELQESLKNVSQEIIYLKKCQTFSDDLLNVKAFGSTDLGGSFLIRHDGFTIFHAGDLNNWHWSEEVSASEALTHENNFLCELELVAEETDYIHLAMFPVDSRLGKYYMRGAEQFISRIKTGYFLPMHFHESYAKANAFRTFAEEHGCRFLSLTHQGQSHQLQTYK